MIDASFQSQLRHTLSLLGTCALLACAAKAPPPAEEKPKDEAPKLIGRIASIPRGKPFVMVQFYEPSNYQSGTVLTTRGAEERSANLLLTGEKLGNFAAADIQSGSVETGDAVYSVHKPAPKPEEAPPANPPQPKEPEPGQKPEPELPVLPGDDPNPDSVQKIN